jgi:hypothetical protein
MGYSGWKELERRHAKRVGGIRIWRQDYGESKPDGESDVETWDCKYSINAVRLLTWFQECEAKYREYTGQRNFHMVFYGKKTRHLGDIVAVRADRFAELLEYEKRCKDFRDAFVSTVGTE